MQQTIILTPSKSAGASPWQTVDSSQPQVVFSAPGLAGVEQATLQQRNADGSASDVYEDGSVVALTATHTELPVVAAGKWRVNKTSTAAAVGIEVSVL